MRTQMSSAVAVLSVSVLVMIMMMMMFCGRSESAPTVVGFYARSCPQAESIVWRTMVRRHARDKTMGAALLRLLFHDAFVKGADASILLNSTSRNEAEKDARPNLSVRGYDVIEEAKAALEAQCPGVVSCADIIPLLVRDAIALAGGPKYEVPTGRRDTLTSLKADTDILPDPAFPISQAREMFFEKGLNTKDFVSLLGAHTIGSSLCGFFSDRMFNYHGTGGPDPAMNASLANKLSVACPNPFFTESSADPLVFLDQATPHTFDSGYYEQLLMGNGILMVDAELPDDESTRDLVRQFTNRDAFFASFVQSITKLSNLGVLTGTQGEVRKRCDSVNIRPSSHRPRGPINNPLPPPSRSVPQKPPFARTPSPTSPRSKPVFSPKIGRASPSRSPPTSVNHGHHRRRHHHKHHHNHHMP